MNKSFSVLTVSKRTGWEQIARESVYMQTVKQQGMWFVVHDQPLTRPHPWMNVEEPPKTKLSNLNAALNAGLKYVKEDYVIFYQDFIELPPDCFQKLLDLADENTFVTTCTPNYDGSDDGRYTGIDAPRICRPEEWETNVAIAPMKMIRELGGFDEDYDWGWSCDNVNLAQRAAMLGANFILDESNRPKLLPHEQEDKKNLPYNADRHNKAIEAIRRGEKSLKLDYL